jgi:hypothetical protein
LIVSTLFKAIFCGVAQRVSFLLLCGAAPSDLYAIHRKISFIGIPLSKWKMSASINRIFLGSYAGSIKGLQPPLGGKSRALPLFFLLIFLLFAINFAFQS